MDHRRRVSSVRDAGVMICCLLPIFLNACASSERVYRDAYGPGPWDRDDHRDYFARPYLDRPDTAIRNSRSEVKRSSAGPIEHFGRPEPPRSKIPGIADIPEIPDEPTVLPE
ncbi:MAG: hypothetical protein ACU843_05220 [Gammaproteobacteria bacterium]